MYPRSGRQAGQSVTSLTLVSRSSRVLCGYHPGTTFYDLGSGTGRAIFVARFLYDFDRYAAHHPCPGGRERAVASPLTVPPHRLPDFGFGLDPACVLRWPQVLGHRNPGEAAPGGRAGSGSVQPGLSTGPQHRQQSGRGSKSRSPRNPPRPMCFGHPSCGPPLTPLTPCTTLLSLPFLVRVCADADGDGSVCRCPTAPSTQKTITSTTGVTVTWSLRTPHASRTDSWISFPSKPST